MASKKTAVYFVPGLAAGEEIFRNIHLPEDLYEVHFLKWLIPKKKESLEHYAGRMAAAVADPSPVLIGVSFGGVVAQEMSAFLSPEKLIIISSVKTKEELPRRLKWARKTLLYKLVPTRLVIHSDDLTKFAIGPKTEKRLKLYQEYLHIRDRRYLDWAIREMVCWDRTAEVEGVIHIHGTDDMIFPVRYIKRYIPIEGGTHVMILYKAKLLTKELLKILQNN